uniref:Uncharacterized protein n=1 Tax=Meloidogyne hapla TaxID=6305 RepID=A0A1I8BFM9_MELHA
MLRIYPILLFFLLKEISCPFSLFVKKISPEQIECVADFLKKEIQPEIFAEYVDNKWIIKLGIPKNLTKNISIQEKEMIEFDNGKYQITCVADFLFLKKQIQPEFFFEMIDKYWLSKRGIPKNKAEKLKISKEEMKNENCFKLNKQFVINDILNVKDLYDKIKRKHLIISEEHQNYSE